MNFKFLKNEVSISIRLILDSLRKIDPLTAHLLELYAQENSIKDICNKTNMSRFRVKRRLDKGLRFVKNIVNRENIR